MSDEDLIRKKAVAAILAGVTKKTALIVLVAVIGVFIYSITVHSARPWWPLPGSILFGGVLGLLNFRWLALAVERIYLKKGATPGLSHFAAIVINLLKLSLIFIVLFIVIKWNVLPVLGLVAGLSLCFLAILWEGMTVMKQARL